MFPAYLDVKTSLSVEPNHYRVPWKGLKTFYLPPPLNPLVASLGGSISLAVPETDRRSYHVLGCVASLVRAARLCGKFYMLFRAAALTQSSVMALALSSDASKDLFGHPASRMQLSEIASRYGRTESDDPSKFWLATRTLNAFYGISILYSPLDQDLLRASSYRLSFGHQQPKSVIEITDIERMDCSY